MGATWQLVHCHRVNLLSTGTTREQQQGEVGLSQGIQELQQDSRSAHTSVQVLLKTWGVMAETSGPGSVSLENNSDSQPSLLSTLPVFNQSNYCWALAHHVVKCFRGYREKKRSNCGLNHRRKKTSVRTSSYQKWDKESCLLNLSCL